MTKDTLWCFCHYWASKYKWMWFSSDFAACYQFAWFRFFFHTFMSDCQLFSLTAFLCLFFLSFIFPAVMFSANHLFDLEFGNASIFDSQFWVPGYNCVLKIWISVRCWIPELAMICLVQLKCWIEPAHSFKCDLKEPCINMFTEKKWAT